ncbi:Holliday junction resolvase RuvX [Salsipaludibacter albus]|uniref:Holliday junction resolvase RuvX n=1 Tax=Salsipaludibacter albus TaxID=2849650 RepID=UPI001EE45985
MDDVALGSRGLDTLPAAGRLLGVDVGDVRVGLAVTDPGQVVATPLDTVPGSTDPEEVADVVLAAIHDEQPVAVVVGYPRTMAGREGSAAQQCRVVAEEIASRSGLPVLLWDERLSTVEAERALLEGDVRRRRRRDVVDRVAASLILRGVLDARRLRR